MSTTGSGDGGTSTVSTETVTGWHMLKVEGYSQIKGICISHGKQIKSGTFSVGGHRWHIEFDPDDFTGVRPGWMFVGLYLDLPAAASNNGVTAWPTFSVLNQAGGSARRLTRTVMAWSFSRLCSYHDDIHEDELVSPYLKDDCFHIRCDLTVFKEIHVDSTTVDQSLTAPPPDLHHNLGDLLASELGGDVTFEVGGENLPAHKYNLAARSSVFKEELFGPMKEKATYRVRIDDMEPRVFRAMLRFIYTDTLPEIEIGEERIVMHQHLLVAADRYSMETLRLICEDVLCKHMGINIAATTLMLAEQHDCPGLKEACFKFLRRPGNLRAVMETDGFQHLKNSCPSLLEELLAKVAP